MQIPTIEDFNRLEQSFNQRLERLEKLLSASSGKDGERWLTTKEFKEEFKIKSDVTLIAYRTASPAKVKSRKKGKFWYYEANSFMSLQE